MDRVSMCNRIGNAYKTSNIEGGEYSYVQAAGSREKLIQALGYVPEHFKLDIRFENNGVVVLVETKQNFVKADEDQLREYLAEEKALHPNNKIICILANTNDDQIRVWKTVVDDAHLLGEETVLDAMEHYESLFETSRQNDRETVLKNTYRLNETLHKKDIDERLRSQFVGTTLLYIRDVLKRQGIATINDTTRKQLRDYWSSFSPTQIRTGIGDTLTSLLDGSENKELKIELLKRNVINDQKVKKLALKDWIDVLDEIVGNIYRFINTDTSEGQDILNLFFIAFNKYTGKADKNQAFTPDHITNFMCRVTGVDRTKRVFDGTCGSGSFLVQAMVLELADCNRQRATEAEKQAMRESVRKEHIFGIEIEEKAYGLSTTNMLIHGDGNSNVKKANLFDSEAFFREADPDIILMNPPYNAKPINVSAKYKTDWKADAKEDPTKGMVFLKFISDTVKKINKERSDAGKAPKEVKIAILLPVSAAIGTSNYISDMKKALLEDNTLEAVFTLPNEIFYPGASASACCMVFTLGKPHKNADGTVNKTFFGYYKEDGHKKKKNLGRIEQFDEKNNSIWKQIEEEWLDLYRNKTVKDGISAMQAVSGNDEWLCEAYMKTDYSQLCKEDFQIIINNYVSYLIQIKKYPVLSTSNKNTLKLNTSTWKDFFVKKLFRIEQTNGIVTDGLDDGNDIPYIAAKHEINGFEKLCSIEGVESWKSKGNCVIFIQLGEGSCGFANYSYDDFIGMNGKTSCGYIDEILNPYIGLFLTTILCCERPKHSFGRSWTGNRLTDTIIKLPIQKNEDGYAIIDENKRFSDEGFIPDWQFMEDYIKSLPYGDRLEG